MRTSCVPYALPTPPCSKHCACKSWNLSVEGWHVLGRATQTHGAARGEANLVFRHSGADARSLHFLNPCSCTRSTNGGSRVSKRPSLKALRDLKNGLEGRNQSKSTFAIRDVDQQHGPTRSSSFDRRRSRAKYWAPRMFPIGSRAARGSTGRTRRPGPVHR